MRAFLPVALLALLPLVGQAVAAEPVLIDLYRRAQASDPVWAAAKASFEAGREYEAIGLAGLRPSLSASVDASWVGTEREPWPVAASTRYDYTSASASLRLNQPLFDLARFAVYKEGVTRSQLAEVDFAKAGQDLFLRVADAYFNFRLALDSLDLARAQKDAISAQKRQTENLYRAGAATITDVEESRARELMVEADALGARNAVDVRRKELERIVGPLAEPETGKAVAAFPTAPPEPDVLMQWLTAARERNLTVLAQELQRTIAKYQVDQQRAGHYPSATLVGSYSASARPSFNTNDQQSYVVGVQVSMPLYEGGRVSAQTRQAAATLEKLRHETESARRDAEVLATQSFLDVVNGVARIAAYEQAVKSSEIALQGMEAGQQAGFRTNSDVLNAQQQLYSVRLELQRERYGYLLSRLRLKSTVGELTEAEVHALQF
jgi:outer membrane protein